MEHESDPPSSTGSDDKSLWLRIKNLLVRRGAPDTAEELEQEIQDLLDEGEEQGLISSHQERMISSIFDFRETVASEIMTPSAEIVAADESCSAADLIRMVNEEGYTRIPIYRGNLDNILGILHVKDLLRFCTLTPDEPLDLKDMLLQPAFIPEDKPIMELLREFQSSKNHIAIIIDEFGGVRGLVTLEDVLEEIVGEIGDEHDEEEQDLQVVDPNTVVVKARADVEVVTNHFQVELEEGPYTSVGGLILHRLGSLPESGTIVTVDGLEFKIVSADRRRIRTVQVRRI